MVHVSAVHIYPVKSLRGQTLQTADLERQGLRHDRRWMVVDESGATLTARSVQAMLSITAHAASDGALVLTTAGRRDLHVAVPSEGEPVPVGLSRVGTAVDAGTAAEVWLTRVLGRSARLVWLDDPTRRTVSAIHGGIPGDVLSFADTGPVLLTSTASLRRLDRWIAEGYADRYARCGAGAGSRPSPLAMERFRPNIVVEGDLEPFVEDGWRSVRVGSADLRFSELADRCVLTTLEPGTGRRGDEPLRTLARHRRWDGHVWFGVRLVPDRASSVAVGDAVVVGQVARECDAAVAGREAAATDA